MSPRLEDWKHFLSFNFSKNWWFVVLCHVRYVSMSVELSSIPSLLSSLCFDISTFCFRNSRRLDAPLQMRNSDCWNYFRREKFSIWMPWWYFTFYGKKILLSDDILLDFSSNSLHRIVSRIHFNSWSFNHVVERKIWIERDDWLYT